MRGDVFRFTLTHFREIAVVYEKLPPGQQGDKKKSFKGSSLWVPAPIAAGCLFESKRMAV